MQIDPKYLHRLSAEYRFKISLLPEGATFQRRRKHWTTRWGSFSSLKEAVDFEFDFEIQYLIDHGACPLHPIGDAFRDHPETLPTMLGLDPRLDNLIAFRLKSSYSDLSAEQSFQHIRREIAAGK
jgi:hypothetical protein